VLQDQAIGKDFDKVDIDLATNRVTGNERRRPTLAGTFGPLALLPDMAQREAVVPEQPTELREIVNQSKDV